MKDGGVATPPELLAFPCRAVASNGGAAVGSPIWLAHPLRGSDTDLGLILPCRGHPDVRCHHAPERWSRILTSRTRFALLTTVFTAVQLYLILVVGYGPFRDETFYITSGLQFWSGDPYAKERYLEHFNGAPYAWPLVAGGMYHVGGLAAARLAALLCFVTSLVLAFFASERLVGAAAAFAGIAVLLATGNSLILAHYATYDLLAFFFLALAFWAVVRWLKEARLSWAVLAGLSLWAASVSKYPYALMGLPLVALMLTRGGPSRVRDSLVLGATAAIPFFGTMRAMFGQWIPPTLAEYRHFTFSPTVVAAVTAMYVAVPVLFMGWASGSLHWETGECAPCSWSVSRRR